MTPMDTPEQPKAPGVLLETGLIAIVDRENNRVIMTRDDEPLREVDVLAAEGVDTLEEVQRDIQEEGGENFFIARIYFTPVGE